MDFREWQIENGFNPRTITGFSQYREAIGAPLPIVTAITKELPCNAATYRCKGGLCMFGHDCEQNDRHECPECYDVLST